jgi:tRNA pseudouridine38-40 synthase
VVVSGEPDVREDEVVFLTVSYDGAPFAGFQRQEGLPTVQGRLEDALSTVLRTTVSLTCAGRTDAGVHALGQVVSYPATGTEPDEAVLRRAIGAFAGPEVQVTAVRRARPGSSARFSALTREYRYRVCGAATPPVFLRDVAWWVKHRLDVDAMRVAAGALVGTHDFASFCVGQTARRVNTERTVDQLDVDRAVDLGEEYVAVRIVGRGFLHSMVRIVAGTLVEVGLGRRTPQSVSEALAARDRVAAGVTAPPHGLTLHEVRYPDDLWIG